MGKRAAEAEKGKLKRKLEGGRKMINGAEDGDVERGKKKNLAFYVVAVSTNVGLKGLLVEKRSLNKPRNETFTPALSLGFEQCHGCSFVSSSTSL